MGVAVNIVDFNKYKGSQKKISMISCYEYWSSSICEKTDIDCLLVGDSVAMVLYGYTSTIYATEEMMIRHTQAVRRGAPSKFIVSDMPFMSFRQGPLEGARIGANLIKAGANAVKVEGVKGHEDVITFLVQSGIPVMGHLGLTPQFINSFGGFKVQAKEEKARQVLLQQALELQELGCFSVVLECIPTDLASKVTEDLIIPTIGIGAGPNTDGQVLVFHDLIGVDQSFYPKFLKKYSNTFEISQSALNRYSQEVKQGVFPSNAESFQ